MIKAESEILKENEQMGKSTLHSEESCSYSGNAYSTLTSKLKNAFMNSWALSWISGTEDAPGPWLVYISPTNVCNQNCRTCALKEHNVRKNGFMEESLFKSIVDQLFQETQRVYLMKQGEPLLHPKICDFAEYLKDKRPDIEIAMHTNGTRLNKEKARRLAKCLDFVTCSIHTIREERYQKIHRGRYTFKEAVNNFAYFVEKCQENKRPVKLFVDYVRQIENQDEEDSEVFETFNRLLPGVNVGIHNVFSYQNTIEEGCTKASMHINENDLPRCFFPWTALSICHDGKISYCLTEPIEKVCFGDVREQTLKSIWNNQHFRTFRKHSKDRNYNALKCKEILCLHCSWLWSMDRLHHKFVFERDATFNRDLIEQAKSNSDGSNHLCKAYAYFLEGKVDLAETEAMVSYRADNGTREDIKPFLDVIKQYRALWEKRNIWTETCTTAKEKYEEFNKVNYRSSI